MPKQCPHCGFMRVWKLRRNKLKCKKCRREFSTDRYLSVSGIRATEKQWRHCIKIFLKERTINRIIQETGFSHCQVSKMVQHLRAVMLQDAPEIFTGTTEIDETYVGGQRKNKKLHIRRLTPPKSGHGTDKLPIIGLFNRDRKQIYVQVIERQSKGHGTKIFVVFKIIRKRTAEGSTIYTDSFRLYRYLNTYHVCNHYMVNHDGGEYSRGNIHTNNIEGFWGILKRKLGCIGGMRRESLKYFVAEIAWKFNHKSLTYLDQENRLINLLKEG